MDGGGEVALFKVDEETLVFAASLAHQSALEAVETASDDAYLFAIDAGGYFLVAEVFYIVGLFNGFPELLEILGSYAHGLKLLASTHITVLQEFHLADDGVELFLGLMHKDKVGHEGDKAHHTLA